MSDTLGVKGWLIKKAIQSKIYNYNKGKGLTHFAYDNMIFNRMKPVLGGRVRMMITGSAPIPHEVLDFLKVCFCVPIIEGYGLTESCGISTSTALTDAHSGHVGGPLQCVKVRLRDLPDMDYTIRSVPPKGEICFFGSSVSTGYFKNWEQTSEMMHNGWLLSGDVAQINPNGSIQIIDRVTSLFKLK